MIRPLPFSFDGRLKHLNQNSQKVVYAKGSCNIDPRHLPMYSSLYLVVFKCFVTTCKLVSFSYFLFADSSLELLGRVNIHGRESIPAGTISAMQSPAMMHDLSYIHPTPSHTYTPLTPSHTYTPLTPSHTYSPLTSSHTYTPLTPFHT